MISTTKKKKIKAYPSYPYLSGSACAAAIAPAIPPRIPGIPCKLFTPQVSWVFVYLVRNGCENNMKNYVTSLILKQLGSTFFHKIQTKKKNLLLSFWILVSIFFWMHCGPARLVNKIIESSKFCSPSSKRNQRCSVLRQSSQSKELPKGWLTYWRLFLWQHHRPKSRFEYGPWKEKSFKTMNVTLL